MPTIDSTCSAKPSSASWRRAGRWAISLRATAAPSLAGRVDAHGGISITPPERSPAELEAERKRKADREWWDRCWKLYT